MGFLVIVLLGGAWLCGAGYAQQVAGDKKEDIPVFRASVTLIKVDVKVSNREGRNLTDLREEDFIIFDENQPQKVSHFAREDEPLDILLLLDVSGSMSKSLGEMAATTRAALAQLRPGDRVALMLFAQRTALIQPLTEEFGNLQNQIIGSIYKQTVGRGTLIADALVEAARYLRAQPQRGRRAILIVTDNQSEKAEASSEDVMRGLLASDTVLNALVVGEAARPPVPGPYSNPNSVPPDVFKLSERTGGEASSGGDIGAAFQSMIARIRGRYALQYAAPDAGPGTFRKIRVELSPEARRKHPDTVIKARSGYWAGEAASATP